MSDSSAAIRAYLYLQATSLRNAVRQRLRRLRQPKYFFGALVGIGYFWLVFFRPRRHGGPGAGEIFQAGAMPADIAPLLLALGAALLLVLVVLTWLVPGQRAALQFTETEIAFLFPAPIARRTLIQLKLLRSQLAILVSALLMTLVFRRASFAGVPPLLHAVGWWLVLSTLGLHAMAASFTHERLLGLGLTPIRRAIVQGVVAVLLIALVIWWVRGLVFPTVAQASDLHAEATYIIGVLNAPPLGWLLWPGKAVLSPLLATDTGAFLRALPAALALLALHYVWVVRSDVAFEEASIAAAKRRGEQTAALREGRFRFGKQTFKPRPAPFRLAPRGFAPIAFLWKGLIAMGGFYRLRTFAIACVVVVAGGAWLGASPERAPLLRILGMIALVFGGWMLVAGPMLAQRSLRNVLTYLDIHKSGPLTGWQIVLGELMAPMAVMVFALWWLLLVVVVAFGPGHWLPTAAAGAVAAIGIAVVAAPLCGLMLSVPLAGVLVFPAWIEPPSGSRGPGVEVMGQRLIFFAGYLLVLAVALAPAGILGFLGFAIGHWLGPLPLALALAALGGGAVLVVEFLAAIWWLGERLDRFDLSQDLPRS